jgi:hypothetical protein
MKVKLQPHHYQEKGIIIPRIIYNIALRTVAMYSLSFFFSIQKVSGLNLDEKTECRNQADFHTAFKLRPVLSHVILNSRGVTLIAQLV